MSAPPSAAAAASAGILTADEAFALLAAEKFAEARPAVERLATSGEPEVLLMLGLMQCLGAGMPLDRDAGMQTMERASEAGSALATYWLLQTAPVNDPRVGIWLERAQRFAGTRDERVPATLATVVPQGILPQWEASRRWNEAAAEAGSGRAWLTLAQMALYSGRAPDTEQHRAYLRRAGEAGESRAWSLLALYSGLGLFGEAKDGEKSQHYGELAAAAGDADWQLQLGRNLLDTKAATKADLERGLAWVKASAVQGNVGAMNLLGDRLRDGADGPVDDGGARAWYARAVKLGDPNSLEDLGWMMEKGRGAPRDPGGARQAYTQAAGHGSGWAMEQIARMMENGIGGPVQPESARAWWEQAAAHGRTSAMIHLGAAADQNADKTTAFEWFEKAAQAGDAWAQNRVGWMLQNGEGIDQDVGEAIGWYKLAAEKGMALAYGNLVQVYAKGLSSEGPEPRQAMEWWMAAARAEIPIGQKEIIASLSDPALDPTVRADVIDFVERRVADEGEVLRSRLAMFLGLFYSGAPGGPWSNRTLARTYFDQAGAWGEANAAVALAESYAHPLPDSPAEPLRTLEMLESLSDAGNETATGELFFFRGFGPPEVRDRKRAEQMFYAMAAPLRERIAWHARSQARVEPQPSPPSPQRMQEMVARLPQDGDRPPVPVWRAKPVFPMILRMLDREGEALVSFIVDTEGRVVEAKAENADEPEFGAAAVAAVSQWRFAPGRKDGRAVNTRMQVPIVFSISDND